MEEARMDLPTAIKHVLRCRTGNEFQATVQEILRHRIRGFQAVEPYGNDGDGGNDGYSRTLGLYAQIYAPVSQSSSARNAARKTARDFAKLRRKWQRISPIRNFLFVMNASASNIHVEEALSLIERKHGVKARFLGTSELAEEAIKMDRTRLEELMGFKVRNKSEGSGSFADLDLLAKIDPKYLDALHLLAALAYPLVPKLCQDLLPNAVDWHSFWKWAQGRGWLTSHGELFELDKKIIATCHKNKTAQKRACEQWVPVLLAHDSIDCLYLSIRPLVMLSRLTEAVRVIADAGTRLAGSGWDESMLIMWEVFDKPKLLRQLSSADRITFMLARANLLTTAARDEESFNAFTKAFRSVSRWPRSVNRPLMTLNFGVAAHRSGHTERAAELYDEAVKRAKQCNDDWVLGRAASNLAQTLLQTDPTKAAATLAEGEAAKKRTKDRAGLVTVVMVRGLIAAEAENPAESSRHFLRAKKLLAKLNNREILAELAFNLAKSYGELGRWQDALKEYRVSLKEAERRKDVSQALRAKSGLAEAYFHLKRWRDCGRECEALARLPDDTPHVDYRLAGQHGLLLLMIRGNMQGDVDDQLHQALEYARRTSREDWIGRILIDRQFGAPNDSTSDVKLERLLSAAKKELKSRRPHSAMALAQAVWSRAVQGGDAFGEVEDKAKSLLDLAAIRSRNVTEAVELLKWQYSVLMTAGEPMRAARCLSDAAELAGMASLWDEYAGVVDQQAVVLAELERPDLAVPLHKEALRIASKERLSNQVRISTANLSECLRRLGRHRAALKVSTASLALQDECGNPEAFLQSLHNHYLVLRGLRRREAAAKTLRRCETFARKHSIWREVLRALMARGNSVWDRGQFTASEKLYRRALKVATKQGIASAEADCRYNLAILLRRRGRNAEAIDLLDVSPEPTFDPLHSLHRLTFKALLLEDVGRLENAQATWMAAARLGEGIEDEDHYTYCHTRVWLLKARRNGTPEERARLADRARDLITAIYDAPAMKNHIQRAYEEAQAHAEEEHFEHYRIRTYQAVADRLSLCAGNRHLTAATQASIASLVMAIGDERRLCLATQAHVRWLMSLNVTHRQFSRLKGVARDWLRKTLRKAAGVRSLKMLLSGFDAVGR